MSSRVCLSSYLAALLLTGLAALLLTGCGDDGRYGLEGAITFEGQPVLAGEILLAPDTAQGNSGPGAMAKIKDGRYETSPGKGHTGGPHVLTITGYDGQGNPQSMLPDGEILFRERKMDLDLPKESSAIDLEIPSDDSP